MLKYTVKACRELEKVSGKTIFQLVSAISSDMSLDLIVQMYWAGSLYDHKYTYTIDQAEEDLDKLCESPDGMKTVIEDIITEFAKSMNSMFGISSDTNSDSSKN